MRRAVLTWCGSNGERIYAKVYKPGADTSAACNLELLTRFSEGRPPLDVPRPVRHDRQTRAISMTEVPGERLTAHMADGDEDAFGRVGEALASLHGAPILVRKVWSPGAELDKVRSLGGEIVEALPHLNTAFIRVIRGLEAVIPTRMSASPIHGNLFGDQILVRTNGVGIVDWDDLASGDPHFDVGRLIAHHIYLSRVSGLEPEIVRRCTEALLRGYRVGGGRVGRASLGWHTAAALVLRGKISALRTLPTGWTDHLAFVLEEASRIVAGRSPYVETPRLQGRSAQAVS